MKKKIKKIFSINAELGYRNYTVKDLQDIKGKIKLSQILVSTQNEARAAEEAGVDLILARADDNFRSIRLAAPKTFITAAIPLLDILLRKLLKALEVSELGADSLWILEYKIYEILK